MGSMHSALRGPPKDAQPYLGSAYGPKRQHSLSGCRSASPGSGRPGQNEGQELRRYRISSTRMCWSLQLVSAEKEFSYNVDSSVEMLEAFLLYDERIHCGTS